MSTRTGPTVDSPFRQRRAHCPVAAEFRFEGREVFIRREPATGDLILSQHPESRESFFQLRHEVDVPQEFLAKPP